jgi:hypothetical protein
MDVRNAVSQDPMRMPATVKEKAAKSAQSGGMSSSGWAGNTLDRVLKLTATLAR